VTSDHFVFVISYAQDCTCLTFLYLICVCTKMVVAREFIFLEDIAVENCGHVIYTSVYCYCISIAKAKIKKVVTLGCI
jgi:hypothetical protein